MINLLSCSFCSQPPLIEFILYASRSRCLPAYRCPQRAAEHLFATSLSPCLKHYLCPPWRRVTLVLFSCERACGSPPSQLHPSNVRKAAFSLSSVSIFSVSCTSPRRHVSTRRQNVPRKKACEACRGARVGGEGNTWEHVNKGDGRGCVGGDLLATAPCGKERSI